MGATSKFRALADVSVRPGDRIYDRGASLLFRDHLFVSEESCGSVVPTVVFPF